MGAEVSLEIEGGIESDLGAVLAEIEAAERRFSIFDPTSELSKLNAAGGGQMSAPMAELLALCDDIHRLTEGSFDPTVQPVFAALMEDGPLPWSAVGWRNTGVSGNRLTLGRGQALTLNGIAQGYATDQVTRLLRARGFTRSLVSVGETAALGGPYRLALEDPSFGQVGTRSLTNRAIATSSPGAMMFRRTAHIFHPLQQSKPLWSTVSVEAESAALADGLSTGLCLLPRAKVEEIAAATGTRVTLVDFDGDVSTLA